MILGKTSIEETKEVRKLAEIYAHICVVAKDICISRLPNDNSSLHLHLPSIFIVYANLFYSAILYKFAP